MRNILKRVVMIVFCAVLCFNFSALYFSYTSNIPIKAKAVSEDDVRSALSTLMEVNVGDETLYNYTSFVSTILTTGYSRECAIGFCIVLKCESGGSPYAVEGFTESQLWDVSSNAKATSPLSEGGKYSLNGKYFSGVNPQPNLKSGCGHGIIQFSQTRGKSLVEFSEQNKDKYPGVEIEHLHYTDGKSSNYVANWADEGSNPTKYYNCSLSNMAGQTFFMLQEMNNSYSDIVELLKEPNTTNRQQFKNTHTYSFVTDVTDDSDRSRASFCGEAIEKRYIVSASGWGSRQQYLDSAIKFVDLAIESGIVGSAPKNANGADPAGQLAADLLNAGLWSEDQFVDFVTLNEDSITLPTRDGLEYSKLREITAWRTAVENKKIDKYTRYPRAVFMFIGIIITLYSIFLYLAWQFDRINNFIDISVLSILTFRRFMASPDGTSNFADTGAANKVLAHKDIIKVTLIGMAIGVLLISGKIFDIVASVVGWVSEHF